MIPIFITSIEDPRIQAYRSLDGTPEYHSQNRIFIAEGKKITKTLLESNLEVISVFALPEFYPELSSYLEYKNVSVDSLFTADKYIMNQIVGFRLHEGVMAIGRQPEPLPLSTILFPAVVLSGIVNSENVGAILRNCAAFGIESVIVDSATSSPFLRRAVRVSMGAVFGLTIYEVKNLHESLTLIHSNYNATIIAIELTKDSKPISSLNFPNNSIFIFGSEGRGIHQSILENCHAIVSIPIANVQSLNVAATSAIVLYHYRHSGN
ncbi:MAG: RNA methyltransferase [Ignavibacteria bacterium]|nr:RNA methyltransferase [Ignavibacteria bacterium]